MGKRLLHTPEGVRDIYGLEYDQKSWVEQTLRQVIGSYGYDEIQTPTFEFFDVFSREVGTTPSKELYKFFDKEGNTLALRPDFTPSIARCASKYFMEDQAPLRFCYHGSAFHNISNLQGKWNELTQIGADLINDDTVEADAEMIGLVVEALRKIGLTDFLICIGHVDYFKGLCEQAGLDAESRERLQEYICGKNTLAAEELLRSCQIDAHNRERLLHVADWSKGVTSLEDAKRLMTDERSSLAISRLESLYNVLQYYNAQKFVSFDLGMLSQYHYYSGMIFKAYTYGVGNPIVQGGRYNHLLSQFGKQAPAVGFVMQVDDLLSALNSQGIVIPKSAPKTILHYHDENYLQQVLEAQRLRQLGDKVVLLREID